MTEREAPWVAGTTAAAVRGVVVVDHEWLVCQWSRGMADLTGNGARWALGRDLRTMLDPVGRGAAITALRHAALGRRREVVTVRLRTVAGPHVRLDVEVVPLADPDGDRRGALLVCTLAG